MHIGQFPPAYHTVIEAIAIWAAFRLYLTLRKRDSLNKQKRVPIVIGGMLGAAIGSKLLFLLQDPGIIAAAQGHWEMLLEGKSLVGALLGGWIGIETAKKIVGVRTATGDSFVVPLAAGILLGRIGCFLCGFYDHTYGVETTLPWAVDFGDGVRRHSTQIYEIIFIACFLAAVPKLTQLRLQQGDLWKFFITAYMTFRFFVEFIKPVPHLYFGLDIEQLVAIGVWLYYAPFFIRRATWTRTATSDA